MAEGAPAAPPRPGGQGGVLPKDPRQRRMALAVAGASIVALVVILRGREAPAEEGIPTAGTVALGADPPFGTTFADNGEAAGELGFAITDSIGGVEAALGGLDVTLEKQAEGFAALNEALAERAAAPPPATAPSVSAAAGNQGQAAAAAVNGSGSTAKKVAALHAAGIDVYGPGKKPRFDLAKVDVTKGGQPRSKTDLQAQVKRLTAPPRKKKK